MHFFHLYHASGAQFLRSGRFEGGGKAQAGRKQALFAPQVRKPGIFVGLKDSKALETRGHQASEGLPKPQ